MKKVRILSLFLAAVICLSFAGCTPFDSDYGESEAEENPYKNVSAPDIKSDDEKMPTFFDISLFDEENYSQIYLGKKYEYNFIYAGGELELPSDLSDMQKSGWQITEPDKYNEKTQILPGKSLKINFTNAYGKQLTVQFTNSSKSSVDMEDCKIVKYVVPQNNYLVSDSVYGQFFINGVSNESAITDVIEYLGAPSHFYAVSEDVYYLDYFLTPKDKRSKIRVYIDVSSDNVTAVEVSKY